MWFNRLELYNPATEATFILAPRPRYSIEKVDYRANLSPTSLGGGNCASCGSDPIENWSITFTIHCLGNGDLAAARLIYNKLVAATREACASNRLRLLLQYCDELPLEHDITGAYIQPIQNEWQPDCCDSATLSLELHMTGLEVPTSEQFEIILYDYMMVNP